MFQVEDGILGAVETVLEGAGGVATGVDLLDTIILVTTAGLYLRRLPVQLQVLDTHRVPRLA